MVYLDMKILLVEVYENKESRVGLQKPKWLAMPEQTKIRQFSQPVGRIYHRKRVLGFATGSHGI